MPDAAKRSVALRCHGALTALEAFLCGLGAYRLAPTQLGVYPGRGATHGWRLHARFSDAIRRLDFFVDRGFPRSQVRVALVDRPPFLTWPHVEKDGALCLLHGAASVDPFAPADVVAVLLGDAYALIEDLISGRCAEDFGNEFVSYWNWSETASAIKVFSLLRPSGPSRAIRVWRGRDFHLIGETDGDLLRWLAALPGSVSNYALKFEPGALLWRETPLAPAEFPKSGRDFLCLADPAGAEFLTAIAAQRPSQVVAAIGSRSPYGACFGAVSLRTPRAPPRGGQVQSEILEAGFRRGRTPPDMMVRRFYGGGAVVRSSVERMDRSWVHGRDQDPRQSILAAATVTVLGCGSVGAAVAVLLAQAGVGQLRLVDDDRLKAANIGRHPLGARDVGRFKAVALAEHLRERFPQIDIVDVPRRWENLDPSFELFTKSDLIVSTMGDWAAEGALNAAHIADGRSSPILYGWTEAQAAAGQAVLIGGTGGCFQCGLDAHGSPLLPVTAWPTEVQLRQEPACGAVYQPYGSVELGYVISLIAELALDKLLGIATGGEHRIWATRSERLAAAGGGWSNAFMAEASQNLSGGFIHMRLWACRAGCQECCAKATAA